jgi:hypothetical protein
MSTLRTMTTSAVLAFALGGCAQMPDPGAASPPANTERLAAMDAHMKSMHDMHDKMSRARTPEDRQALMAEHMKLMHEGMAMMDGMHGMGPTETPERMKMMEKHMEMMHSMMQMMMDQMAPAPTKR